MHHKLLNCSLVISCLGDSFISRLSTMPQLRDSGEPLRHREEPLNNANWAVVRAVSLAV